MTLTAQQLQDIVKANPEAWPEGVSYSPPVGSGRGMFAGTFHDVCNPDRTMPTPNAVMLHEAAAIDSRLALGQSWEIAPCSPDDQRSVRLGRHGEWHTAPTLIEALHAAISESKKGEGR